MFFYPISKDHLCTVTFALTYVLDSRAASNQEEPMMAHVLYVSFHMLSISFLSQYGFLLHSPLHSVLFVVESFKTKTRPKIKH